MKVLLTSTLYPTPQAPKIVGGAEIFARRFAEGLAQRGDEVEVIRASSRPEQAPETCDGINVYSAPVRNVYLPFTEQKNVALRSIWHAVDDWQMQAPMIAERIRAFKPDVLHSNNLSGLTTAIWRVAAQLGVPVLHTLHDYYLTCPRCSRFDNGRSCEHTCTSCAVLTFHRKRATHWLSAVVGVSERVLSIHTDMGMFADTPIRTVIRNASTEPPREPYPRPVCTTEVTFGFIGRLTEEKGIDNLMHALAMLPPDRIRMMIAGRVSEEEQRRLKAIAPHARIEFMGFVAPDDFYRQVDVVVAPSIWHDPGPLVVADAKAAGRPLLGTRFGGMPEVIEHGVTGWLTEADPQSLARSMLAVADDPHKIDEISRRLIADTNKWIFADVLSSYKNLYEQLREQRMSRMRAATNEAPQGRAVGKERLIPR
ncbi:glycosyl transferase [Bradyrhizobium sp. WBOS7]|uniref:Glycosyl transferase n=1 Tax=Bradyrhizobium betae TaxID=244734 RepID=A0AAE9N4C6_9BRAD|nr:MULTISPECIES: glycosyltransferase family 4 protein [Bradyrhizobium]MDD1573013.1 glycosyl transferase [Bradyrhizobium sp. WBOS1]UUO33130.1 glycosyl transferase [Bradyrhizobium sp. WBOS01]MDD1529380.1 glycosyl transferase [Bradyrhizobium sp. WBOS2]MDD1579014.1 glycosyl transferase [Bradyrhizobium sp. WBOS7]MDD1601821.1 glycosyl transferase [Bradyrhizobium sp. WBOS16]